MQGRLSNMVGSKFHYFPISEWENEFSHSKKLGFDGVEWIVSNFSNPLFSLPFRKIIQKVLKKNNQKIISISLDIFMYEHLKIMTTENVIWISKQLSKAVKYFKIKRVSIPIEENGRFNTPKEMQETIKKIQVLNNSLKYDTKVAIETDYNSNIVNKLIYRKNLENLGIVLDLGNTNAHGFDIKKFLEKFKNKIYSIHIKYRPEFYGKSKMIPKNFKILKTFFNNVDSLEELNDICFQTYKSDKNFMKDIKNSIINYNINYEKK